MERDGYILTSSDEAFALGEQGRRILLGMAVTAHIETFRVTLSSIKASFQPTWSRFKDDEVETSVSTMAQHAFRSFVRACGVSEWNAQLDLMSISNYVSGKALVRQFFYRTEVQERPGLLPEVAATAAKLRAAGHANILEAVYGAADPTLSPEYAKLLMPVLDSGRRAG